MKIKNSKLKIQNLANFIFEASTLKRLQRTGWQILGDNQESVAAHSFMVAVISYVLAKTLNIDNYKVVIMALFHDFTEARVGDVYKLADLYISVDEKKASRDAFASPITDDLFKMNQEYEKEKTVEAKIVHDADTLALCIELKQLIEKGNLHAKEWYNANLTRLKLNQSKVIAEEITRGNSQNWWKKEREKLHKSFKK